MATKETEEFVIILERGSTVEPPSLFFSFNCFCLLWSLQFTGHLFWRGDSKEFKKCSPSEQHQPWIRQKWEKLKDKRMEGRLIEDFSFTWTLEFQQRFYSKQNENNERLWMTQEWKTPSSSHLLLTRIKIDYFILTGGGEGQRRLKRGQG